MAIVDALLAATIKFLQKKQKKLRRQKARARKIKREKRRQSARQPKKVKTRTSAKKPRQLKRILKKSFHRKLGFDGKKKAPDKSVVPQKQVGTITHYFSRIEVVVIKLSKAGIAVGDRIHVVGATTDFTQRVKSLQIESIDVSLAKKGALVGLKVEKRAKEGDKVYWVP